VIVKTNNESANSKPLCFFADFLFTSQHFLLTGYFLSPEAELSSFATHYCNISKISMAHYHLQNLTPARDMKKVAYPCFKRMSKI